jgi:uncharacterized protein YciU (UPF0263 family)
MRTHHKYYIDFISELVEDAIKHNRKDLDDEYVKNCNDLILKLKELIPKERISYSDVAFIDAAFTKGYIDADEWQDKIKTFIGKCFKSMVIIHLVDKDEFFDAFADMYLGFLETSIKKYKTVKGNAKEIYESHTDLIFLKKDLT